MPKKLPGHLHMTHRGHSGHESLLSVGIRVDATGGLLKGRQVASPYRRFKGPPRSSRCPKKSPMSSFKHVGNLCGLNKLEFRYLAWEALAATNSAPNLGSMLLILQALILAPLVPKPHFRVSTYPHVPLRTAPPKSISSLERWN